jgi:hypothetical protein
MLMTELPAYTMSMARKSGLLMLAVAVLWIAMPLSACLSTALPHACCKGMMRECGTSSAMANRSCCEVDRSDPAVPPGMTASWQIDPGVASVHATVPSVTVVLNVAWAPGGNASPPQSLPRCNSILRI